MKRDVLFIHGAGHGAWEEDAPMVTSMEAALGTAYAVRYPRMVREANPDYPPWKAQIAAELARLDGDVVLVGHSLGGSILMKYLSEERVDRPIVGLITLAAPYWGADEDWNWEDARLPENAAEQLSSIPRLIFYHSRDDEIVPFGHLALYGAAIPQAAVREVDGRGHQFADDLTDVARDIVRMTSSEP